jgi:hypothetical protein
MFPLVAKAKPREVACGASLQLRSWPPPVASPAYDLNLKTPGPQTNKQSAVYNSQSWVFPTLSANSRARLMSPAKREKEVEVENGTIQRYVPLLSNCLHVFLGVGDSTDANKVITA